MKHGIAIMIAAGGLLLGGCNSAESEKLAEVSAGLAAVRAELTVLDGEFDKKLTASREHDAYQENRRRKKEAFAKKVKPLPENPTDAQILAYVDAIIAATGKVDVYSSDDPQVEWLGKIGPGHLHLLLPYMEKNPGFHYWSYAMERLVGPQDKEIAIRNLQKKPALQSVIVRNNWVREARPEFIALLKNGKANQLWRRAAPVTAQLGCTEAEREELVDIFITYPNTAYMFPAIRMFPGIDLAEVTTQAWEGHCDGEGRGGGKFACYAARYGNRDALLAMLEEAQNKKGEELMEPQGYACALLGRSGTVKELLEYCRANREKLMFDPVNQRYVLKEER